MLFINLNITYRVIPLVWDSSRIYTDFSQFLNFMSRCTSSPYHHYTVMMKWWTKFRLKIKSHSLPSLPLYNFHAFEETWRDCRRNFQWPRICTTGESVLNLCLAKVVELILINLQKYFNCWTICLLSKRARK